MDAIAMNKPCKLNFNLFYNILSYEFATGLSGHFLYEYSVLLTF